MPQPIYEFSTAIQTLVWVRQKAEYHETNHLVSDLGRPASAIQRGLYLYLYSNHRNAHPIHNRNTHHALHGKVICPADCHTLKSGKFTGGLHEHIRKNLHGHLWRPTASPVQEHITPQVLCWFLVFDSDPVASAPRLTRYATREKYFNSLVCNWLSTFGLQHPQQPNLEHRWIPPQVGSPPISANQGREFLEGTLERHPDW